MAVQTVDQLKQEVATEYLKKYKNELGWLKSLALYPLEKEVKNILSGNTTLPEKFDEIQEFGWWGKVLGFISKDMASDLLNFMKEKRLIIEQKKTESELVALKNEVLGREEQMKEESPNHINASMENTETPHKNDGSSTSASVPPLTSYSSETETSSEATPSQETKKHAKEKIIATESVAGAMALNGYMEKQTNKKLAQQVGKERLNFGVEELKKMNDKAIELLKQQKKNPRLAKLQLKNIDKSIERFQKNFTKVGSSELDILKAYQEVSFRVPAKILEGIEVLNPKILNIIEKHADEVIGLDEVGVKAFFKTKGIDDVSDNVIQMCKGFNNTDEVLALGKVLKSPSKLKGVFKMFRACFLIDIACLGFDIWAWDNGHDEAEMVAKVNEIRAQNKRDQANMQLYIGVASVVAEVGAMIAVFAAGGSVFGPIGTVVGVAVGVLTVAASMGVDTLYYDVRDFYLQDKEDYIRKTRAEVKQAILQHLHNKKEGNISLNEKLGAAGEDLKAKKIENLQQAYEALFFLEEGDQHLGEYSALRYYKQSGQKEADYVATLNDEEKQQFTQQKEKLNKKIALRVEYIKNSLHEKKITAGLKSSQGQKYLSKLLGQSAFYAERKEKGLWKEGVDNGEMAKKELLEKIPETIKTRLDGIAKKDPHLLYELYQGAKYLAPEFSSDALPSQNGGETSENNGVPQTVDTSPVKNNALYIVSYIQALEVGISREEKYLTNYAYRDLNYRYVEAVLEHNFELAGFTYENFSSTTIKSISYNAWERNIDMSVSDKVSQNIIYRLAKELYGYTGENDAMALMQHFSEDTDGVHGLYYKDGRYINNDWAKDQKFDLTYLDDKKLSDKEVNMQAEKIIKDILYTADPNIRKSMIDTPTEAIDKYLNDEFETTFKQILQEELQAHTTEKKTEIQQDIATFIKDFSKDGGYVELPYYLVIAAKRAGIGDLEKVQFAYKDGKIIAVGQKTDLRAIDDLPVEKEYVQQVREKFSDEEMQYIHTVEAAHKQLEALRNIQGTDTHEDDLDIPREIENDISQHWKDWNTLKGRLLCYNPEKAQLQLLDKDMGYKKYYDYFTTLYQGILLSLNSFKTSNDIDTMSYFQMALAKGNQELFDEKGALKKDEKKLIIEGKGVEEFYNKQLESKTYNGKSIKDLRASTDEKERESAKWYSSQIVIAMLETYHLKEQENQISGFRHSWYGATKGKMALSLDDQAFAQRFSANLEKRIQRFPIVSDNLSSEGIPAKSEEEIGIVPYYQKDHLAENVSKTLQQQIEKTAATVDRGGKRGDIIYHPEDSTLESRGQRIPMVIEGEDQIRISGFSRSLDFASGMWLLNFINWYRAKFPEKTVNHRYGFSWSGYRKGLYSDRTTIIIDKNLEKTIKNLTDGEIDEIATLLNNKS